VLPVTVPILSLDPRLRGVVRGTSNVSLIIGPTYQNYLSERAWHLDPADAPGLGMAGPRLELCCDWFSGMQSAVERVRAFNDVLHLRHFRRCPVADE
jgi:hypothetical protein